jgi:hemerythrin-like domain-containing protein
MENTTFADRPGAFGALLTEHQDGLQFAARIRRGLDNHTPANELAKYVRWYWQRHIRSHFYQEEKIVLSLLPQGHPLSYKAKIDHDEIRELMLLIDMEADRFYLQKLANFIESHIGWEEKYLFPYLEKYLTSSQLADLKKEMDDHPIDHSEAWKNEFWLPGKN